MAGPEQFDCVVENARLVTCDSRVGTGPLGILEDAAVAVHEGRIAWVGPSRDAHTMRANLHIDAKGGAVLPGLVDCHTHLVFAGSRVDEFARKMAGEDYRAIAAAGGGIASTVRATREADDSVLAALAEGRARAMRSLGTTTVEIKSGYGLTVADEVRCLRVARDLDARGVVRTSTTFLGAHAVPPEYRDRRADYVDLVAGPMLDAVAEAGVADACDAYLDDGAFTVDEGRRVLARAKEFGLRIKAHVGQFQDIGAAELVAELGGLSVDHLERVSDAALEKLAAAGVVAVLLPGAWSTLRDDAPRAERLRAAGLRIAVGTDANPGTSPALDLGLMAALAVRDAGLTAEEAILGITSHAAAALGRTDVGRIATGCHGDLVVHANRDPRTLAYALGSVRPRHVLLGGQRVAGEDGPSPW